MAVGWRFVIGDLQDQVALPVLVLALGVFVPGGVFAGEADDEDVSPAVAVEVVGEGEEILGIPVRIVGLGHEIFASVLVFFASGEVGAFVPVGADDDVHLAVFVA